LKQDAPPIPNKSATETQRVENGKVMFVAALPSSPTLFAMNSWSIML